MTDLETKVTLTKEEIEAQRRTHMQKRIEALAAKEAQHQALIDSLKTLIEKRAVTEAAVAKIKKSEK